MVSIQANWFSSKWKLASSARISNYIFELRPAISFHIIINIRKGGQPPI